MFDFQTPTNNHKHSKTVSNQASKSNLEDIDNKQKTSETDNAKYNRSENGNIMRESDIVKSKLIFNTEKCELSFCNSINSIMDINDSSEPTEKSTAQGSSLELSINGFIYHKDECIENNLLKLMKEINAPNYAFKK